MLDRDATGLRPVVSELGPVVIRFGVGIRDQADALDLLVAVFRRRVKPERSTMGLRERPAHHLGDKQRLRMAKNVKIVAGVVITVRRLHVDVSRIPAVDESGRVCLEEIGRTYTRPMDDLAPAFDAFELRDKLPTRKGEEAGEIEKQTGRSRPEGRVAFPCFFGAARSSANLVFVLLGRFQHGGGRHFRRALEFGVYFRVVSLILVGVTALVPVLPGSDILGEAWVTSGILRAYELEPPAFGFECLLEAIDPVDAQGLRAMQRIGGGEWSVAEEVA